VAASRRSGAQRLVRISDLAKLSGVPTPTIKHYMREGLLPGPEKRTSRNMAYYDARLAERVRVIKELQQSRFLPLKLIADILEPPPSASIRRELDAEQRKQLGALEPAIAAGGRAARSRPPQPANRRRSRAEVLAKLRISGEDLEYLEALGLIEPAARRGGEPIYTGADLDLLEVIDETRAKGLGDLFPMPILEPFVAAVRTLVRVEIELFRRRVLAGAKLPAVPLDQVASEATQLSERLIVAMRAKLMIPELRQVSSGEPDDGAAAADNDEA
jgi:DNA-binding transcriptional MerR regulator